MRKKSEMNTVRSLLLAGLTAAGLLMQATAHAESSVWQVTATDGKNKNTLYIAGTLHLLKAEDFPLPEEFEDAYKKAENLVFEADLSAFNDPEVQNKMQRMVSWDDGSVLADHVKPETLARFESVLNDYGIPLIMVEQYRPGFAAITIALLELQKLGIGQEGVDAFYDARARQDGRAIDVLETVEQQLSFIANMGMENPDEFLNYSMDDLEGLGDLMDKMRAAWRAGDMPTLATLMTDKMRDLYPEVYKSLLTERNLAWVPKIKAMMQDPDVEMVLVGAGHLAGEGNVLELLEKAGYELKQLP